MRQSSSLTGGTSTLGLVILIFVLGGQFDNSMGRKRTDSNLSHS